jgi:DNA-binding transcriptional LysR family regulator
MNINNINLNQLRVFEAVFRTRSMTHAAQELRLTQSGVSQHISHLEDTLGVRLFDRIRQRIFPTHHAETLYSVCSESLRQLENALQQIHQGPASIRGKIRVGMPMEFGNNVVLPLIAEFLREHPGVQLKAHIGLAAEMNELLLSGAIDFAFIDQYRMDASIQVEKIYDEVLELCVSESLWKKIPQNAKGKRLIESIPFVDYQEGEPILRMWLQHHYGSTHFNVDIRAQVMDVHGIARLVVAGVGAGVLPLHMVERLIQEGAEIRKVKGPGAILKNTISLAQVAGRTQLPATQALMDRLKIAIPKR